MGNYIGCAIVIFVIAWIVNAIESWESPLVWTAWSFIWAAALFYPMGWLITQGDVRNQERTAAAVQAHNTWIQTKEQAGCKRSSYVATKNSIHAVWTCPDGVAHLEQ